MAILALSRIRKACHRHDIGIIWAPVSLLVFSLMSMLIMRVLRDVGHVLDMYWRDLGMVSGMCSACVMYVLCLLVIYIDFSTRPLPQLVMLVFLRTFLDSN